MEDKKLIAKILREGLEPVKVDTDSETLNERLRSSLKDLLSEAKSKKKDDKKKGEDKKKDEDKKRIKSPQPTGNGTRMLKEPFLPKTTPLQREVKYNIAKLILLGH